MSNVAVVYQSKYGSTEQYARWIHGEVKSDLVRLNKNGVPPLESYDTIVFGGSIRMGKVEVAKMIEKYWEYFEGKKLAIFVVGAAETDDPEFQESFENSISSSVREKIAYFPLRGRSLYKQLDLLDKALMRVATLVVRDEQKKREMMTDIDGVERENIGPIVEYLKEN